MGLRPQTRIHPVGEPWFALEVGIHQLGDRPVISPLPLDRDSLIDDTFGGVTDYGSDRSRRRRQLPYAKPSTS